MPRKTVFAKITKLAGYVHSQASIYNAMPRDGVVALCDFMRDFAKKNG